MQSFKCAYMHILGFIFIFIAFDMILVGLGYKSRYVKVALTEFYQTIQNKIIRYSIYNNTRRKSSHLEASTHLVLA